MSMVKNEDFKILKIDKQNFTNLQKLKHYFCSIWGFIHIITRSNQATGFNLVLMTDTLILKILINDA